MENEMIERVALAAWIAYSVRDDELESTDGDYNRESAIRDWNEWPKGCTHMGADGFRRIARKAIEAMREPTPDMVDEGDYKCGHGDQYSVAVWQAMIDAALKG